MPRSKPKKAEPRFSAHSYQLTEDVKGKLCTLLGNSVEKAILDVEKTLGLGHYGAVHMDDIPRPADYIAAFKPIEREAIRLHNSLCELGGYFGAQFTKNGADQGAIEAALLSLISVAGAVVNDFEALPSKGAPKNNALTEVIRRLRRIFRDNYKGPQTGRTRKGSLEYRAKEEEYEVAFVVTALLAARLISASEVKTTPTEKVERLFIDPRCAMPDQRTATVNRLAAKVKRSELAPFDWTAFYDD